MIPAEGGAPMPPAAAAAAGAIYRVDDEYRPAVVEFLRRHEGAALRLDFVPTSAGSPPLPTIHALGGDGGSLDCFRSFHLHIQGWGF